MEDTVWKERMAHLLTLPLEDPSVREGFLQLRAALERGEVRAASPGPNGWVVHSYVKEGILLGFRLGQLCTMDAGLSFVDKDTYPARKFTPLDRVRIVPGGSSVRSGAYLAPGVVVMPPAYINVGAFVDEGSLVDSHALVGSCAQVGKRVHLSAACQVGGVIEPVGAQPVVIEDDSFLGGNTGVYEGVQVGAGAVLGTGVILNGSSALYDAVKSEVHRAVAGVLKVPPRAVVVMGSRVLQGAFAHAHGLMLSTPIIIKYRDEKTGAKAALEDAIRSF